MPLYMVSYSDIAGGAFRWAAGGEWVDGSKRRRGSLIVTENFESNRLEEENLGAAYELILPVSERVSRPRRTQTRKLDMPQEQQLGIFSLAASQ